MDYKYCLVHITGGEYDRGDGAVLFDTPEEADRFTEGWSDREEWEIVDARTGEQIYNCG